MALLANLHLQKFVKDCHLTQVGLPLYLPGCTTSAALSWRVEVLEVLDQMFRIGSVSPQEQPSREVHGALTLGG